MSTGVLRRLRKPAAGFAVMALMLAIPVCSTPAHARITRIVIDERVSPAFCKGEACASFGDAGQYEQLSGRAFGELDPGNPLNRIIQDVALGKDADGKVRYIATFVITKPVDMSKASGLMWHDVPNRGRPVVINSMERAFGDVGLASAWQGDNASMSTELGTAVRPTMNAAGNHWLQVPVARNPDGSSITGPVLGRIINRSGPAAQPLIVQTNPVPYLPATLDTSRATLVSRDHESQQGVVTGESPIAAADWKFCGGGTFDAPVPLTGLPVQICLKGGFNPAKLYQVVYTAKDPYILGIGFAAWRDVASFFKYAAKDDTGTANPLAGRITNSITRGRSQSGNYLRGWLHLGFNQDEAKRQVHEGMWPIIAGRRIALNFRWAQPDGVMELYQPGSEGPQWWTPYPDQARVLPARSILDRCNASRTCPKVIEHFGAAEIWGLRLGPEWVGTNATEDIPLPDNVRRYYIPSTAHGGGRGGFDSSLPAFGLNKPIECPGNNAGFGVLPANPMPHTETVNALTVHFRNWVMHGTPPPPNRYPTLREGQLVEPTKTAMGLPTIPGLRASAPEAGFINAVLDYDWGPAFDPSDGSGVPGSAVPRVKQVLKMLVPKVDADGNEVGGVPVVLRDAPLGTYLGWNITAGGERPFHKDKICTYAGGMIPFAKTKAERVASGDSRLSLEERYTDHAGYVTAVRKAAANAVSQKFLLQKDADVLIAAAEASGVLRRADE
ncbi:MAG TPA: alpha/beta hydrolase domain-containing protein [Burkholderiales bacterium]|nr:alpha/beta hydrolase domain-containing protein [Burkholderiales bacterium]